FSTSTTWPWMPSAPSKPSSPSNPGGPGGPCGPSQEKAINTKNAPKNVLSLFMILDFGFFFEFCSSLQENQKAFHFFKIITFFFISHTKIGILDKDVYYCICKPSIMAKVVPHSFFTEF